MFTYRKLICLTGDHQPGEKEETLWRQAGELGAKAIILREPELSDIAYGTLARRFLEVMKTYPKTRPILHGHVSVARELGHPYLHLPLPILKDQDEAWQKPILLGTSCHNPAQLTEAVSRGADYVFLSPVFPTASKPGAPTLGLLTLKAWTKDYPLPVYALGGIDLANAEEVLRTGVAGVAMLRGWKNKACQVKEKR